MEYNIDVLIIGAGPAGLAAANYCLLNGDSFLLVEKGKTYKIRDRNNPADLSAGVGGAGLFSDGKLSFSPSAFKLWNLPSEMLLRKAYAWFGNLVTDIFPSFPAFPATMMSNNEFYEIKENTDWYQKKYESLYLSDVDKVKIIERLITPISHRLLVDTEVKSIKKEEDKFISSLQTNRGECVEVTSESVILCTGHLNNSSLAIPIQSHNSTFEVGVKIEQPTKRFFLKKYEEEDVKLLSYNHDHSIQWKTFCCCKNAKVYPISYNSFVGYAGMRAPTNKSNVGFNVCINKDTFLKENQYNINSFLSGNTKPFKIPIKDFLREDPFEWNELHDLLCEGLILLGKHYDLTNSVIYGPCLEKQGIAYHLNADLASTSCRNFHIAGDASQKFRGLLAAFLSGYYVAEKSRVQRARTYQIQKDKDITPSDTLGMKMIFTAQSKAFFYCRDTICEYVLEKGFLPINPFRVFDYFLGDRCDRKIIRKGNNHLVQMCDELWVFGEISNGVLFEIIYALKLQKPIRFFTIGAKIKEIHEITDYRKIKFESELTIKANPSSKEDLLSRIWEALAPLTNQEDELPLW